jgi:hypothetical protein
MPVQDVNLVYSGGWRELSAMRFNTVFITVILLVQLLATMVLIEAVQELRKAQQPEKPAPVLLETPKRSE